MKSTDDFQDYLNMHEFYKLLWDRIPEELISNMYMDDNEDFIREITFSMYNEYKEDRVTLNLSARLLKEFIRSMFKYKPMTSNLVDNKYVDSQF